MDEYNRRYIAIFKVKLTIPKETKSYNFQGHRHAHLISLIRTEKKAEPSSLRTH